MREQNFRRVICMLIVFAWMLTADVFAQSKNPTARVDSNSEKKISEALHPDDPYQQIAEFSERINRNPKEATNYAGRAAAYIKLERYDEALSDLNNALELDQTYDEIYAYRGYVYYLKQRYAESVKDFEKALQINPKSEYARETLGLARAEYDKNFALAKNLTNQIEAKPRDPQLYADRAKIYEKTGKQKEAEADLKKRDELKAVLRKDVFAECPSDDYDCQIKIYNEQIKIALDSSDIVDRRSLEKFYSGRAISYYHQGNLDDALEDLNRMIDGCREEVVFKNKNETRTRCYPYDKSPRNNYYRGKILFRQGKYDDALKDFNSSTEKFPEGLADIGDIYFIKRDYVNALKSYEWAIEENRRNAKAYYGRGLIRLKLGNDALDVEMDETKAADYYRKAVKDFDSVIEIDLQNVSADVYKARARAFDKLGEPDKAAADRAKAAELPDQP